MFGALSACFGGGALLGALIQAARGKASWVGLLAGATGFSAGLVVLAPMRTAALAGAVLFAVGVCFTIWVANTSALLQLRAPDRLRGRVMSLFMFAFAGLAPIGGLWAGWVMDVGGTQLALILGGAASLTVIAYAWTQLPALRARHALLLGRRRSLARGLGRVALGFGAEDALEFLEVLLEGLPARVELGRGSAQLLPEATAAEKAEAPGAFGAASRPSRPGRRRAGELPRSPGRHRDARAGRVARSRSRPGPRGRARTARAAPA